MTFLPTEPELVVGIDPSLRHTGLALDRKGQPPVYHEIKTGAATVPEAIGILREEFAAWLHEVVGPTADVVWALEQQMAQADINGWLMMLTQCAVCEVIHGSTVRPVQMVAPYPNQLKAYIKRMHGVSTGSKTEIRYGHQRIIRDLVQSEKVPLVSSHKAEAWFLTQLARDVLDGQWSYKQSPLKVRVFPWPILRGVKA